MTELSNDEGTSGNPEHGAWRWWALGGTVVVVIVLAMILGGGNDDAKSVRADGRANAVRPLDCRGD